MIKRTFAPANPPDDGEFSREEMANRPNQFQAGDVVEWQEWPRSGRKRDRAEGSTSPGPATLLGKLAYTIPEAGHLLGLCRASVYNLIADGEIATVNLSRRAPRILREELVAFLERKAAAAKALQDSVRVTMGRGV